METGNQQQADGDQQEQRQQGENEAMEEHVERNEKDVALEDYKRKLLQHKEFESKVKSLREDVSKAYKEYDKTEDDLKALQSVGQIIGEVLRQLDEERCTFRVLLSCTMRRCCGEDTTHIFVSWVLRVHCFFFQH